MNDQLFNDADADVADVDLRARVSIVRRQRDTLLRGWHPISGYPLHEMAAPVGDKQTPGLRCATCFFAVRSPAADVFKCTLDQGRYITHKPDTDLRTWFPACDHHVADTPLTEGKQ